tara:strand:+ start:10321 stop:11133 length:813 start_codon:yes stop_codon:yes gene_type:complete
MKIWSNTSTLKDYSEGLEFTVKKEEAEILLLGGKSVNLEDFPNLRGIFRAGVGKDNVSETEATNRNIIVKYPSKETQKIIFQETANFSTYLILKMLYKNIGELETWRKEKRIDLKQKKVLLLGQGNIGKLVKNNLAKLTTVLTFDIMFNPPYDLEKKLLQADCLSIHIPNSPENDSFIDAKKLSLLKDGSSIVNTARGPIVNEHDLLSEIKSQRLYAAFDVFWHEPYYGELREFHPEQFYMTPHVASTCSGFLQGCRKDLDFLAQELSNE